MTSKTFSSWRLRKQDYLLYFSFQKEFRVCMAVPIPLTPDFFVRVIKQGGVVFDCWLLLSHVTVDLSIKACFTGLLCGLGVLRAQRHAIVKVLQRSFLYTIYLNADEG
jgi:hypothetical protein